MTLLIETLANYLGKDASVLLTDSPFKNWIVDKSYENDLDKPLIDYVFAKDGMDFVCDGGGKINSIFLYSDASRCFRDGIKDLPLTSNRQEVIARLGHPSKSGNRICDPVLGEYGAWDRFTRPGYAIHIEYHLDDDIIKKITLMHASVVPT